MALWKKHDSIHQHSDPSPWAVACSWEGCLLHEASCFTGDVMDMKKFAVPPWELSSERGCRDCRHYTGVFQQKAIKEAEKGKHSAGNHGEKTTEPKPALRKHPDHLPLQTGVTTDPFTADILFSVSLHRPGASFSLAHPWCAQQGYPATPNHFWELSSQTKSIWTILYPDLSYTSPKQDGAERLRGKICDYQYEGGIVVSKVCPFFLISLL